jgi:rare lipoprotein A
VITLSLLMTACGTLRAPDVPVSDGMPAPLPTPAPAPQPAAPAGAVPRVELIPRGAPNAPYEINGESYKPELTDVPMVETGIASWYGKRFHGRPTASGEIYDMHAMSAAHKTMPLPSYARVRNPATGREVIVRVNDRGPFKPGRVIDLSFAAARHLRISGVAAVEVTRLTHDEIRSGSWKRPAASASGTSAVAAVE